MTKQTRGVLACAGEDYGINNPDLLHHILPVSFLNLHASRPRQRMLP